MTWPLCPILAAPAPHESEIAVHVPALARFPVHLRDLCAMLPVADINGALFAALEAGLRPAAHEAVGLFLTDPFLNGQDAARRLKEAGVGAVANYPTMQALDGASAEGLASVGHSFAQECVQLAAFADHGFRLVGYAASAGAARALARLGADRLVILGAGWELDGAMGTPPRCFRHAQFDPPWIAQPPMP
jgi:predicted TIM-barrel enzyme